MKPFSTHRPISPLRTVWYLAIIVVAGVGIYFLTVREMRFFLVPTKSMTPTIAPREYLLALNEDEYERGDIVVIEDPKAPGEYLVKRIVAVPGDRVNVRGGALFVNGSYVSEPYVNEPMDYTLGRPYDVQAGEVFVLGDNRNWSVDSHNWAEHPKAPVDTKGVALDNVVGRVRFVYLPFDQMRVIHAYPLDRVAAL